MNYVLFINIRNKKEDYVVCSKFIEDIISSERNLTYSKIWNYAKDLSFELKKPINKNLPFSKLEEPLRGYDIFSSVEPIDNELWIDNASDYFDNIHFHIRVDFYEYPEIQNLQYLAMLITNHEFLVSKKRLSVFLIPKTGNKYPYTFENSFDDTVFNDASIKLRAFIGEGNYGIIYGANHKKESLEDTIVKSLNYKTTKRTKNIFPTIVFNGNSSADNNIYKYYEQNKTGENRVNKPGKEEIDNYLLLFHKGDTLMNYFLQASTMTSRNRFGYSDSPSPLWAMCDYLFESSYLLFKSKCINIGYDLAQNLKELDFIFDNSNIICFAIFSYILNLDVNSGDIQKANDQIRKCFHMAYEITECLDQIVQNSLQHSEKKKCVMSINRIESKLNIIISDLNNKHILESFEKNLINEQNYLKSTKIDKLYEDFGTAMYSETINDTSNLLNRFDISKLKFRYFFNDFNTTDSENDKENWMNFRRSDSSAHIGLALFSNTINKCGGVFYVSSSSNYGENIDVFYSDTDTEISENSLSFCGTEYYITIPTFFEISSADQNSLTKFENIRFNENYNSYAKFLKFEPEYIKPNFPLITNLAKTHISHLGLGINQYSNKFQMQMIYTHYWLNCFNLIENLENKAYIIDAIGQFNEAFILESDFVIETFVKGFFNALSIYALTLPENYELMLSLINLNSKAYQMILRISSALSVKEFPDNVQLFITEIDYRNQLQLFGTCYAEAIQNAYILALELGCSNYNGNDYFNANKLIEPFSKLYKNYNKTKKRDLFPFPSIICIDERSNVFFELVSKNAEEELSSTNVGYKISNCHMRLGNKVHINSFYEMSYLFYRTIMANQVAFYIIKDLLNNKDIDIYSDKIMFYGYASYSQAILMSLVQILKSLRNSDKLGSGREGGIYYSIYQYNLQYESDSENICVYTNNEKEVSAIEENLKVIQIVPISSTMSTFSKIWTKLCAKYNNTKLIENYTVFWVRDRLNTNGQNETELEKNYYNITNNRTIKTKYNALQNHNEIKYIIEKHSNWSVPEKCEKCFPPKDLFSEIPLIETDQTSTVPSQQIVCTNRTNHPKWEFETQKRVASLLGHIHYGHFKKEKNHHQYFINTQTYFNCVSKDVKHWLENIKSKEKKEEVDYPYINIIFSPVHNTNVGFSQYVNSYYFGGTAEIITINEDKEYRSNFKCEHSEIIRNIEKMYYDYTSSNKETDDYFPVRFTFVDDNIVTGLTFKKASSFMQELLPKELINKYTTNVFSKCFVLVNRLSLSTINSYVLPHDNFNAYCNLNISNTRIQGDSCVCCKINNTATRLFEKSSTYYSANYWHNKRERLNTVYFDSIVSSSEERKYSYLNAVLSHIIKNYLSAFSNTDDDLYNCVLSLFGFYANDKAENKTKKIFVDKNAIREKYLYDSYSLINIRNLNNIAKKQINIDKNKNDSYKLFFDDSYYKEYVHGLTKKDIIKSLITVITRPYFTYNQVFRKAIMKFLIAFCEYVFDDINLNLDESSIAVLEQLSKLFNKSELVSFLKNNVFEALSNLNSTYLLRIKTIEKLLIFLNKAAIEEIISYDTQKDVFMNYSVFIQRIVDNGRDETRSLWFEHLLLTGKESYDETFSNINSENTFSESILNRIDVSQETKENFKLFCCELFFTNGKLLYDGISHLLRKDGSAKPSDMLEEYFLRRVKLMKNLDLKYIGLSNYNNSILYPYEDSEIELYKLLSVPKTKQSIDDKYKSLICLLKSMICEKYNISTNSDCINIALLTSNSYNSSVNVRDLEIIECALDNKNSEGNTERKIANSKYIIKKRIIKAIKNDLKEKGYYIDNHSKDYGGNEYCEDQKNCFLNDDFETIEKSNHKNPYFVIQFNNDYRDPKDELVFKAEHDTIVPIYLYISIVCNEMSLRKTLPYFIIRDVLSYRYDLINYFIEDFTTDVMQNYASSIDKEAILENEKVMSHTAMSKDQEEMDYVIDNEEIIKQQYPLLFEAHYKNNNKDAIKLLHSFVISRHYCNATIAKLFNRVFRNLNKKIEEIIANNYNHKIKDTAMLYMENDYISERNIPLIDVRKVIPSALSDDKMFNLFKEIVCFDILCEDKLNELEAVSYEIDGKQYSYNLDFVKSIVYRICFDAMRFSYGCKGETKDFSLRVLNHLYEKEKRTIKTKSEYIESRISSEPFCYVSFSVESEDKSKVFDWLVVKNLISPSYINTTGFIKKKLEDPLDFADGHMSLVATKEYFALLMNKKEKDLLLNMYSYEEQDGKKYFITKLPIIKKE